MTQRNVRGAYYRPEHDRKEDWDWLAKWQPNVIRFMVSGKPESPDSVSVDKIQRLHDTCPEATILLRVWEIDDNNFKAHDAMVADPAGTAQKQLDWWAGLFDRITGVPRNLLMAGLNNETGPEKDGSLYPYTERALELGTQRGVRLGVFVFSVGRPALAGESQYDMPYFAKLEPAIIANGGAVVLHEYMQPEGMYAVWTDNEGNERKDYTYLIGRHTRWPFSPSVPIVIGEWGIDGILYNRHPDKKYGNSGWTNFKKDWPPSRYADEYVECIRQASPNVIAICPFISDWSDHKWQSFDLIEAYGEFLARKDLCVKEVTDASTPPVTTHLPTISTGKPTLSYVRVASGANIRSTPALAKDNIVAVIPYAEPVTVSGYTDDQQWAQVTYDKLSGWMSSPLLSPTPMPAPEPTPQPSGDNWPRCREFVRKWEGGYQNNPADIGNWTGCEVGKGENRGTKFGISACSYPELDIQNLSMEEADAIYSRDYWRASGADQLPWPYCLYVFDTAVLHGVGTARKWQEDVGDNAYAFAARRLHTYTKLGNWDTFGKGWVNRMADLLEAASR